MRQLGSAQTPQRTPPAAQQSLRAPVKARPLFQFFGGVLHGLSFKTMTVAAAPWAQWRRTRSFAAPDREFAAAIVRSARCARCCAPNCRDLLRATAAAAR